MTIAVIILYIDSKIQLGVAMGLAYVLVVLIALFSNKPSLLFISATVSTLFTIIGFIASPDGVEMWFVYANRGLAIFVICLTSLIGLFLLQTRNTLHHNEDQQRKILDSMFTFVGLFSTDGILIDTNKAPLERASLSRDNVIGKPFAETYWWSYSPEAQARIQTALDNAAMGQTIRHDERVRMGDDEFITIDIILAPLYDLNGKINQIIGSAIDITDRKKMENKLRSSEEKYRVMFETSQVGMALCKMDGTLIDVNKGYLDIIGYSKEETLELSYWDITPRSYETEEIKQLQLLKDTGQYGPYEKEYIYKDGHTVPVLLNGSLIKGEDNIDYIWSIVHDITELKKAGEKLNFQASHDDLTGLINRREFENRAERLLSTIVQNNNEHALCFMDLDQFKVVNDTCGHIAGDEMLRQLASVLKDVVRVRDTLARLGGDEFGVLMEHCSLEDAQRVATALLNAIQDYQFVWEEHSFTVSVSIGLVPISEATPNLTQLLKDADAACFMAKDKGRNRIHVSHAKDVEIAHHHGEMQWVSRINRALSEDRFCLYAQVIESTIGNNDEHYELLVRMIDEQGKIVPPGAFLPAAERYNLVSKIDHWVIKHAFSLLTNNPKFLERITFCSINLSGQSLTSTEILEFIIDQLHESGINGEKICFEITETTAISNFSIAKKFISTLIDLRCRFALDDFGSGLSSFAYLKNLPVDYLKIDGMFVKDIIDDPIDCAMVKSITDIAQVMEMKTIAEFVENNEIKDMLKEIGVDYVQGYEIGMPQPLTELISHQTKTT